MYLSTGVQRGVPRAQVALGVAGRHGRARVRQVPANARALQQHPGRTADQLRIALIPTYYSLSTGKSNTAKLLQMSGVTLR